MYTLGKAVYMWPLDTVSVVLCRATHVQMEDGSVVLLHPQRPAQRVALARQLLTPGKPGAAKGAGKKVS